MDKFIDIIMFRTSAGEEIRHPRYTTGSIVLGAIMRTAFIVLVTFFLREYYPFENIWIFTLLGIWGGAIYPAYREYQNFSSKVEVIQTTTLCGSCKYFEETGQLCTLLDDHISEEYLPCEGEGWQPRSIDF